MDFVKNLAGGSNSNENASSGEGEKQSGGGGFLGGIGNKLNSAAGGGAEGEKNEDYLDKGVDMVQEKVLGQGAQNNESAVEQAKDEQISDYIRGQYKSMSGSDMPIKDKATSLDRSTD
ncbi:hypothetical protein LTR36_002323 [Oleoguttula mirabilis]|uniref:DNA damage-responsive protein 48 n=1 Tax=Oleoguttula mirabilis TaxID=1507867 RepID=A0AAV9JLF9_9PEZI|nr:hypothetical protein LTR36_002323 [Oleoguttula mirabilis]